MSDSKPCARPTPTIVVPVFDGWPAVETCIESLFETVPAETPVRIIDDASRDARVIEWLDTLEARFPGRLTLVRNAANKGYLRSVNEALAIVEGDVVVANSDTRFTPRWLEALVAVAADPAVGIANPISDNATILSVPGLERASEDALAELRETFAGRWYELPTAVGFCMYIKREALERYGGFDPFFDPGYGEECDYSMRLRRDGLKIAAVPSSIVFHQGSCSFGGRAASLRESHEKLLSLRWPSYQRDVLEFSRGNPIRGIREFLASVGSRAGTRVLHVLHELDYLGGVELFTKELLSRFSPETEHVVLCQGRMHDAFSDLVESRLQPNVRVIRFDPRRYRHADILMAIPAGRSHPELDQLFCRILSGGRFNCVHFHTLVRLGTLSWPAICTALGVPYVLSMHEFFHLCHDYNMVLGPGDNGFCGKPVCHEQDEDCLRCMGSRVQSLGEPLPRFIEHRRRAWREILHGAERIYTNGALVSRTVIEAYGESLQGAISEFEPYFCGERRAIGPIEVSNAERPLHVAFLGAFSPRKGGDVFLAARDLLADRPIRWSVIGNVDSRLKTALDQAPVEATGPYDTSQLDRLLEDVDLIVQAPTGPETYSITLSEAWDRGRPVVAPEVGAFKHRIEHGKNGWLYPPGDAHALAGRIDYLASRKGRTELGEVARRLAHIARRDNPIASELEALYARFPRRCLLAALEEAGWVGNELPEPVDARTTTRKWLEQPMCLEAEDDWADPGDLACLVARADGARGAGLKAALAEQAPRARLVTASDLAGLADDATVLVLQDDTEPTANVGNWVDSWRDSGKPFGTCNYLLHDAEGEPYGPVFRGEGDATFPARQPRRWAGVLARAGRIRDLLERLDKDELFDAPLDRLLRPGDLAHYDGCGLSMLDHRWSQLWKADLAETATEARRAEASVGVLVQGGGGPGTRRLLADLAMQNGVDMTGVAVMLPPGVELDDETRRPSNVFVCEWSVRDPAGSINRAERALPDAGVIVFVGDNVRLENPRLLQAMIGDMRRHDIAAISPLLPSDRRGHQFVARRSGCGGGGLPGYGPPVSTPFDVPGVPLAADFLDDDLFVVDRRAWRDVGGLPSRGRLFYRSMMFSERLRSAGLALARSAQFVRKAALPATDLAADPERQPRERADVLRALVRSQAPSAWSKSMSLQSPFGLECRKHAFKGGGRLPRLLAYAHDVWASGFYRVRAPAASLAAANRASCHFLPEQRERYEPNVMEVVNSGASVLLLHSFLHDAQLEKLADYHRFLDIPVVFSLDDWLLELPDYNPFARTNYPDMPRRVRFALDHCDRLVVPTPKLAEYYAPYVPDIRVVPNRIPRALIHPARPRKSGMLRVGWTGAPQHSGDLDWLAPVVRATRDHCRWVFFGQKPAGLTPEECEFHPPVALKGYFEKLAGLDLDLAVAPLSDNPFNRAKSHLKLLEYAALGLPVVCTDCEAYRAAPALRLENEAGLWTEELIRLADDPESRAGLAAALRRWLEAGHVLEDHLDEWAQALSLQP
ncbi:glycosyltransferase [Wenzhouxiangella sediminis]|uniref:glycosyltransferase n=1 Tax=Wenzhouxiangella sediminis TaxID=1792836 RepID=UPI0015F281DE|nr:glycosyltransferase [Wenzhouxiangella sediminis]